MLFRSKGIPKLVDMIIKPKGLRSPDVGPWLKMLEPLMDAFVYAFDKLKPVLIKAFNDLWKFFEPKVKEVVDKYKKPILFAIAGYLFSTAAINAAFTAVLPMLLKGIGKLLLSAAGGIKNVIGVAAEAAAPAVKGLFRSFGSGLSSGLKLVESFGQIGRAHV